MPCGLDRYYDMISVQTNAIDANAIIDVSLCKNLQILRPF